MAHLETAGKDLLLESFGYDFRYKRVKFPQSEITKIQEVIAILDKAAGLWAIAENDEDATHNPYRRAELELRDSINYWE